MNYQKGYKKLNVKYAIMNKVTRQPNAKLYIHLTLEKPFKRYSMISYAKTGGKEFLVVSDPIPTEHGYLHKVEPQFETLVDEYNVVFSPDAVWYKLFTFVPEYSVPDIM